MDAIDTAEVGVHSYITKNGHSQEYRTFTVPEWMHTHWNKSMEGEKEGIKERGVGGKMLSMKLNYILQCL